MNYARYITLALLACLLLPSCQKNDLSPIPAIYLVSFLPSDSMVANVDSVYIIFHLTDGDADIGNDTTSEVFMQDSRFPGTWISYPFPIIDFANEDPKKGIDGTCTVNPVPLPVPRPDSVHTKYGDTLTYEVYVTDRAGHTSNHITTHPLIIRP